MNVTDAITNLCSLLGVDPVWSRLNEFPPSPLSVKLVLLASRLAMATDLADIQQGHINAVLDGEASDEGLSTFLGLGVDMAEQRDATLSAARQLLGELIQAGLVR